MAEEFGLQVGEEYVTFRRIETEGNRQVVQIPVRISGIWTAKDPEDPYWFYRKSVFENQFFVPEETFLNRIVTARRTKSHRRSGTSSSTAATSLPAMSAGCWAASARSSSRPHRCSTNTRLEVSPLDALVRYRRSSRVAECPALRLQHPHHRPAACLHRSGRRAVRGSTAQRNRRAAQPRRNRHPGRRHRCARSTAAGHGRAGRRASRQRADRADHRRHAELPQLHHRLQPARHHDDVDAAFRHRRRSHHDGGTGSALLWRARHTIVTYKHEQSRTSRRALVAARLAGRPAADSGRLRHLSAQPAGLHLHAHGGNHRIALREPPALSDSVAGRAGAGTC